MADAAGVTHDLVLDGTGYMLAPGSYRRLSGGGVGLPRGTPAGGQFRQARWRTRRIEHADGEGVWYTLGFAPSLAADEGLSILPAGALDTSLGSAATTYGGGGDLAGVPYLAADSTLYQIVTSGGAYGNLASVATASATIQQLVRHKAKLYAALGGAYATWDGTTWSETATPADRLASYAGVLLRMRAGTLQWTVDETTWRDLPFYGVVNGVLAADSGLYLGCERGLYRLQGRLTPSEPSGAPHTYDRFDWSIQPLVDWSGSVSGDNGRHLALYQGAVYAWQGAGCGASRPAAPHRCRSGAPAGDWRWSDPTSRWQCRMPTTATGSGCTTVSAGGGWPRATPPARASPRRSASPELATRIWWPGRRAHAT